jgi:hypothetical protein
VARPSPTTVLLLLVVYVLPLGAAVAYLLWVGLPVLAAGLVAVETAVVTAVLLAKRGSGDRPSG